MDWRHRASCRDEDPELFFPVGTGGAAVLQVAEAKTVCRRCPVNTECVTWVLAAGQEAGVWGGMSEDERRALARRQAREKAKDQPKTQGKPKRRPARDGTMPLPDQVMVDRLIRHGCQSSSSDGVKALVEGATLEERALAAVALVTEGWTAHAAARHLSTSSDSVGKWVARAAAGEPVTQPGDTRNGTGYIRRSA